MFWSPSEIKTGIAFKEKLNIYILYFLYLFMKLTLFLMFRYVRIYKDLIYTYFLQIIYA